MPDVTEAPPVQKEKKAETSDEAADKQQAVGDSRPVTDKSGLSEFRSILRDRVDHIAVTLATTTAAALR